MKMSTAYFHRCDPLVLKILNRPLAFRVRGRGHLLLRLCASASPSLVVMCEWGAFYLQGYLQGLFGN